MIISICIIAFNEESYLPRLLKELVMQDYPHELMEIVLVNSASTDETLAVMKKFLEKERSFRGVQVLENPKKILSAGCNIAIQAAKGDAILRIDAHAKIPSDFIRKNAVCLQNGEDVCGGARPCIIEDDAGKWKGMLLLSENSMFGSGIAKFRNGETKQYVKSLFHGAYKRKVFENAGFFNEKLGRTEDNDMNYRIRQHGYKLYYDPEIISYQYMRPNLKKMLRQKFLNGYWIGLTMGVQPKCFSLYHFVPLFFVMAIISSIIYATCYNAFPLVALFSIYGIFNIIMTLLSIAKSKFCFEFFAIPLVFFLLHLSYGSGTLIGLVKMPLWLMKIKKV